MTKIRDEVLAENAAYAKDFGDKAKLPMPPARRFAILTCMDSGSAEGDFIDWLTIKDQAESATADVARIRTHPLVPAGVPIYGYIYDVNSGRLIEVSEATKAGKAWAEAQPLGSMRQNWAATTPWPKSNVRG